MIEPHLGALEDMVAGVDTEFIYEKIKDISFFTGGKIGDELRDWIESEEFAGKLIRNTYPLQLIFGLQCFWSDEYECVVIGIEDDEDYLSVNQQATLDRLAMHVPVIRHQQGDDEEYYDDSW